MPDLTLRQDPHRRNEITGWVTCFPLNGFLEAFRKKLNCSLIKTDVITSLAPYSSTGWTYIILLHGDCMHWRICSMWPQGPELSHSLYWALEKRHLTAQRPCGLLFCSVVIYLDRGLIVFCVGYDSWCRFFVGFCKFHVYQVVIVAARGCGLLDIKI